MQGGEGKGSAADSQIDRSGKPPRPVAPLAGEALDAPLPPLRPAPADRGQIDLAPGKEEAELQLMAGEAAGTTGAGAGEGDTGKDQLGAVEPQLHRTILGHGKVGSQRLGGQEG